METVTGFDAQYSTKDVPGGSFAATLGQIKDEREKLRKNLLNATYLMGKSLNGLINDN